MYTHSEVGKYKENGIVVCNMHSALHVCLEKLFDFVFDSFYFGPSKVPARVKNADVPFIAARWPH